MKAFRFRLDPLVTLRSWEEERARAAYSEALEQERRCESSLRAIEADLEAGFAAWETAVTAGERNERWLHLERLRLARQKATGALADARNNREGKGQALLQCHRRLQTLETLKSRRKEAHLAEQRRREEIELDEIVSARFQPDL